MQRITKWCNTYYVTYILNWSLTSPYQLKFLEWDVEPQANLNNSTDPQIYFPLHLPWEIRHPKICSQPTHRAFPISIKYIVLYIILYSTRKYSSDLRGAHPPPQYWMIDWLIDWLIDWIEFYAVSAIFQAWNGGILNDVTYWMMLHTNNTCINAL